MKKCMVEILVAVWLCGSAEATITAATTIVGYPNAQEGYALDSFEGASITSNTPLHGASGPITNLFTSPDAGAKVIFDDAGASGTVHAIEFYTASSLILTNLTVWLKGDDLGGKVDGRSISNIKLWSSNTPDPFSTGALIIDAPIDPDYTTTYGGPGLEVYFDLGSITGQYHRIEFTQAFWDAGGDSRGPRVMEIDANHPRPQKPNTSMIINGGFENTGSTSITVNTSSGITSFDILGWRCFNTAANAMTFEVVSDAAGAIEGSNYLRVTSLLSSPTTDGGIDTDRRAGGVGEGVVNLTAHETYTLSFDLKNIPIDGDLNSVSLVLRNYASGTTEIIDNFVDNQLLNPSSTSWSHYSYNFTPTADGEFYIAFRPKNGVQTQTERFLLDNVNLDVFIPMPITPASIIDWSFISTNIVKLVINAPAAAKNYYPISTMNLVFGNWTNVPHSSDGVAPFVTTNLDYSTTDATGTNEVIYVKADATAEFYRVIGAEL